MAAIGFHGWQLRVEVDIGAPREQEAPGRKAVPGSAAGRRIVIAGSGPAGTFATASWDGTARLWRTDPDEVANLICSTTNTRISAAEWSQAMPDVPFQAPCP